MHKHLDTNLLHEHSPNSKFSICPYFHLKHAIRIVVTRKRVSRGIALGLEIVAGFSILGENRTIQQAERAIENIQKKNADLK